MTRKGVTVLGSTGSIGRSTLDVIARHPDRFYVAALTARHQWQLLLEQAVIHRPHRISSEACVSRGSRRKS